MKVALFMPVPTVTPPGTVMLVLLLDKEMAREVEAGPVRVIVQSAVPGEFTIAGEQVRLLG